ncbi:unnamed protein product [Moneuplotes crassus]|uniref:Uncharacterized protein n=1 Tax=Euplotes crassus TaxID=5936 RepID=A0AAD1URM8_EUPCR|nr:unnamed protein product [Moneuplotes crassus]
MNKSQHQDSLKTERMHSNISLIGNINHRESLMALKMNKSSESAFITSVPKLSYGLNTSKNYGFGYPIDEREEQREVVPEEIMKTYEKLQEFIRNIEGKISGAIHVNEEDFCIAFKRRMKEIKAMVRELREKCTQDWLKIKEEQRMKTLTEQRNFYKTEAFKLDKLCNEYKLKYKEMKSKCDEIKQDRDFFEAELKKAKKINKLLYLQNLDYNQKKMTSDSSMTSIIRKDHNEFSERSSMDKLGVTLETNSKKSLPNFMNNEKNLHSQRMSLATPNLLSLKRGKSTSIVENNQLNKILDKKQNMKSRFSNKGISQYKINTFLVEKSKSSASNRRMNMKTPKPEFKPNEGNLQNVFVFDQNMIKSRRSESVREIHSKIPRFTHSKKINRNHIKKL